MIPFRRVVPSAYDGGWSRSYRALGRPDQFHAATLDAPQDGSTSTAVVVFETAQDTYDAPVNPPFGAIPQPHIDWAGDMGNNDLVNQPLVSVIVPAKDQAPFIRDSLTSLARQFEDASVLEVVVVDDGSTDATGELAAAFASQLPGLKILRNESPAGVATARNQGLDAASGRFIAFLDPDDWYAPGYLPKLTAEMEQLDVDFLRTDHIRHTNGTRSIHRAPQALRSTPLDPRDDIAPYNLSTMIDYPIVAFGIYDGRLKDSGMLRFLDGRQTAEDRPWMWRLHLQCKSYAVSDQLGVIYRRGVPTSLTQIYDRRQLDFLPCFEEIFRLVADDPEPGRFWPKAARQFLAIACHHLNRSEGMPPDVLAALRIGIDRTFATLPSDVAVESLALLDPKRRALLAPILRSHA
ncbi:glycosyl transferase family 2 [Arthrobacter crystallopoietes BAB-32]|uniref:Glycosyl transferase family 2 n=1 Tax=Arthrobacter crystallopoietes BAB-32 TaxID=1246476 RepID=N1UYH3_9MICC|nr:glycosyltransferase family 2 protein [Arthrobacter crystallopoietes]EMY34115.1 glycosyl transferase family 2 [Arthrobacter crystallopoietes BAB-32]